MGYPLPGGGVMVAGTSQGVVTDIDGNYSIDVVLPCALEYSYVGYVTQTKTIGDASQPVNVQLMINANELKEVVVVGYGTMEKREVTSSITSIKADNLIQGGGGATLATALRGEISGMTINTSASPNASYGFQLRGVSSINADDSPLVVIDGIPGGHFSSLNQDEIESIDILKDASSTAIYGSRGANGVIMVTTFKGTRNQPAKVTYSGYVGAKNAIPYDMMEGPKYAEMRKYAGIFTNSPDESDDTNTDWQSLQLTPSHADLQGTQQFKDLQPHQYRV